jgi:cation diffusion facilitator CzcD-associated flavoprotein CzcO
MSHFDVVIVGASLSGIGAAYHLQKLCPGKVIHDPREPRRHRWNPCDRARIRHGSRRGCLAQRATAAFRA